MLSLRTIVPNTLELLQCLTSKPEMAQMRLVGGTSSDKDIAAMKINAIIGRGTKKDFVDLYVLLQHYTLAQILDFYRKRYPDFSDYRAMLSLTYFDDAEAQEMPIMFIPDSWQQMKSTIIQAVKDYQK